MACEQEKKMNVGSQGENLHEMLPKFYRYMHT